MMKKIAMLLIAAMLIQQVPVYASDLSASFDSLEETVNNDVEQTVSMLEQDLETLEESITTYDAFVANIDQIEAFYEKVYNETVLLCIRMREYALEYANLIAASDKPNDEKYDDCDIINDVVYMDALNDVLDDIYRDLLSDAQNSFYRDAIGEGSDEHSYEELSDARSDEYERISDTRDDIYDEVSDTRDDIYRFRSDIKSEYWSDDIERVQKKIDDFAEDIADLKADAENDGLAVETEPNSNAKVKPATESVQEEAPSSGIRPEFKETMDSYEAFFDEYCDFMTKYKETDDIVSMASDFASYMTQYADFMAKMDAMKDEEMSTEESAYYLEVTGRILEKVAAVQ